MLGLEFSLDQLPAALQDYLLYPFITLLMCLLSVFVVLGNLLVVSAIWHENQLHSVTNYLIASLAAADCLVGALVMPFSIISEMVVGSWTFGPTWCDLWHSFDVLASTASIMNLCAISLDRYLAITNPICYPTKMTPKRVALLIVSLWTCSSLISFPAILWWRAVAGENGPLQQVTPASNLTGGGAAHSGSSNANVISSSGQPASGGRLLQVNAPNASDDLDGRWTPAPAEPAAHFKCVFTDDTYYLLFSSFVSFYGPLCVMLYAYICIYRAAVQQTRFLKYGSKQVMIGAGNGDAAGHKSKKKNKRQRHASEHSTQSANRSDAANSCDNYERQHLVLRAHRGGGANASVKVTTHNNNNNNSNSNRSGAGGGSQLAAGRQGDAFGSSAAAVRHSTARAGAQLKASQKSAKAANQRASLTDDDGDDEEDDESELDKRAEQMVSSSLDQTSVLSDSFRGAPRVSSSWSPADTGGALAQARASSTNRSARINQRLSRRDRARVEAQRFTSSSVPAVELAEDSNSDNKLDTTSVSGEATPESPLVKHCYWANSRQTDQQQQQQQPNHRPDKAALGSQKHCDTPSENDRSARPASAMSHLKRLSSSSQTTGSDSGGFKFVRALRHSDSKMPPLPASLVPLIMMNSDTSTDSSIVTVVTRPADAGNGQTSVEYSRTDVTDDGLKLETGATRGPNSDTCSTRSSVEWAPEAGPARRANQVTINLSFDEATERSKTTGCSAAGTPTKGQLLHYDSDKLIQSIVDLTNIHYIDCAAIERRPTRGRASGTRKSGAANSVPASSQTRGILSKTLSHGGERALVSVEMRGQQRNHVGISEARESSGGAPTTTTSSAAPTKTPTTTATAASTATTAQRTKTRSKQGKSGELGAATNTSALGVPRQQKSMGRKLTKLAKERKAAKTLGIVVGVFILCWLPFFVVNILVALCGIKCIYKPEILFSVVTWLGWLNSAMNPVIYACWSRDFRRAFRRVLCTWVEFLCYDGTRIARKLKLKKCSGYANAHEIHSSGRPASSTQRSCTSIEINTGTCGGGGVGLGAGGGNGNVIRINSNNNHHRALLSDH